MSDAYFGIRDNGAAGLALKRMSKEDVQDDLEITDLMSSFTKSLHLSEPDNEHSIPENSDFNDYLTDGQYRVPNQSVANTIENIPVNKPGQLIVSHLTYNMTTTKTILQTFIAVGQNPPGIYIRYGSGDFSDIEWNEIATVEEVEEKVEKFSSALLLSEPDDEHTIPENSDFNDYLTDGQYRVPNQSVANTIENIPVNKPGQLIVSHLTYNMTTTKTILQTFIAVGQNPPGIYIRYGSGDFSDIEWNEIATVEEVEEKVEKFSSALLLSEPDDEHTIPENSDFNDYLTDGQYRVPNQTIANTIENIPVNRPGQLIVSHLTYNITTTKTILQTFITVGQNPPGIYIRYGSGDFSNIEWNEIATVEEVEEKVEKLSSALLLSAPDDEHTIPENSDFNDYLTDGQYKVMTAATSRTILNIPEQAIGQLIVFHLTMAGATTNTMIQVYISKTPKMYLRYRSLTDGFTEWNEIATVDAEFSWKQNDFLIHDPEEEKDTMISVVNDILEITISDTDGWVLSDVSGNRIIPAAEIYQMWDYLQSQYPAYIDPGETIGYSLDTEGENYSQIKAYYIHPRKQYTNWSGNTVNIDYQDIPTIYLTAGTHGGESTPTWTMFEIFRRAFLTGTIYSHFLDGLQFRVIPVLDVWCYDNKKRYLAAAYNEDGTQKVQDDEIELYNANRQCVCANMTNPTYTNLTIPDYATEAKALTKYLNDHGFGLVNGDCYIDLHNCSYSLGYLATDNPTIANMYNLMIDTLAKDWKANTTFANGDPVDYYASSNGDHTRQRGKILANEHVEKSYAWFFEKAYSSFASNVLEVQQTDGKAGSKYAFAKTFDITYRWFDTLFRRVKSQT